MLNATPPWTPSSARTLRRVAEELGRRSRVDDAAPVEHDDLLREPRDDGEVLLDEQDRRELGRALERLGDLGHEQGREPLRRLVDEQQLVLVQQRARDRDHLLLPARERAGPLRAALGELREELVDELVARVARPRSASRRFSSTVSPAKTSRSSGT